ncbi:MAG: SpoVA/SpoVAEb family sporulation membrane protein [Oscillospiraceae bacterium]|nr:SpoVA/SpoVAEb family sporulation membrane protein [Oscillospiraceae bacterium]
MKANKEQYKRMVAQATPPGKHLKNWLLSFTTGGLICAFGEGLFWGFGAFGFSEEEQRALVPVTLIFLTAIATAAGIFDKLAKHAGAGTGVPITGFANAIVSPAMEHRSEGHILGTGANLFRLAGPVLTYGSAVCVLYGLIYYFFFNGR